MDNIFYLSGFRGSEGTLLVTRGDVVLLTDSRYTTYAREVAVGCTVVETSVKDNVMAGLFQRYGITKTGFDAYHTLYQTYQRGRSAARTSSSCPLPTISSP